MLVQEGQALGNVQSNCASLLVPGQQARVRGVGILLDSLVQVSAFHVLQHQHGMFPLQAGSIELHQVAVIGQGPQHRNLLYHMPCSDVLQLVARHLYTCRIRCDLLVQQVGLSVKGMVTAWERLCGVKEVLFWKGKL